MKNIVSDMLSPLIIIAGGIFFTFYLGAFFIIHPKCFFLTLRRGTSFRALNLALAGTLGVGNIVGVTNAISLGGEGAVFWMIISAILTSSLKYAEASLAVQTRTELDACFSGGAYLYIQKAFGRAGRFLGVVFALLFGVNTIATGCVMQAKASAEALSCLFGIKESICSLIIAAAVFLSIRHGIAKISRITNNIVPLACAVYVGLTIAVIIINRENVIPSVKLIISKAFDANGVIFGIGGFFFTNSMKCGIMRGLLSNEAGCGSSATAHSTEKNTTPHVQGCMGIAEVLADTVLMCGLTGIALLSSGTCSSSDSMRVVITSFSRSCAVFAPIAAACIVLFGFATVICFAGYGSECISYIFGRKHSKFINAAYLCLYVFAVASSVFISGEAFLAAADVSMGLMSVINIPALVRFGRSIKAARTI